MVHCFGAIAAIASVLLGRLEGKIRCILTSQVSATPIGNVVNKFKSHGCFSSLTKAAGVKSLTAYVDKESPWSEKTLNHMTRNFAFATTRTNQHCNSEVCHRLDFFVIIKNISSFPTSGSICPNRFHFICAAIYILLPSLFILIFLSAPRGIESIILKGKLLCLLGNINFLLYRIRPCSCRRHFSFWFLTICNEDSGLLAAGSYYKYWQIIGQARSRMSCQCLMWVYPKKVILFSFLFFFLLRTYYSIESPKFQSLIWKVIQLQLLSHFCCCLHTVLQ